MSYCKDIEQLLSDYLDGELDRATREAMDRHLADCPPCLENLDSFRSVVRATSRIPCDEISLELRERLRSFLAAKIQKTR